MFCVKIKRKFCVKKKEILDDYVDIRSLEHDPVISMACNIRHITHVEEDPIFISFFFISV